METTLLFFFNLIFIEVLLICNVVLIQVYGKLNS